MTILEQIAASEQIGTLASAAEREGSAAALFGVHKVHRAVAAAAALPSRELTLYNRKI